MSATLMDTTPQSCGRNPLRASSAVLYSPRLSDMSGSSKPRNDALPSGFMFSRCTRRKSRSTSGKFWSGCLDDCVVAIDVLANLLQESAVALDAGGDGYRV